MANRRAPPDRSKRPLGAARLDELALSYVAKFATSRAKLTRYLSRKIRESDWTDDVDPVAACEAIADRMERLQFLDDRQYAAMRAGAMTRRGLGVRRVKAQLYVDGIAPADSGEAIDTAEGAAVAAAVGFARRRRFGPFAMRRTDDPKFASGRSPPSCARDTVWGWSAASWRSRRGTRPRWRRWTTKRRSIRARQNRFGIRICRCAPC